MRKDTLTEEEIQYGLRAVIRDGLASQAMATLTGGIFLVVFALKLGASHLMIGLLAALPPLAQFIQIPSIYLIEKIRSRRTIIVYTSTVSRTCWLFIALVPFLFPNQTGLTFLLVAILLYSTFSAIFNCSWNSWMRDLIPQSQSGSFFSKRMSLATGLGMILSLSAGIFIEYWEKSFPDHELHGYSALFFLGFLAGMIGVYFISTIPEPRVTPVVTKVSELILQPFKDANFRNLIMFSGSWNFAVNLAAPFFTIYMVKRLELDMSLIIALKVLSQLMNFAFLRIWGGFVDRFSNKSVLSVSGPLFIVCILAWTFTSRPERYVLTIPLLLVIHIFVGISTAGVTLASTNIGLKLAPQEQATVYLAASNLVNSLAAGIAPILGGHFVDFFATRELSLTLKWTSPGEILTFQTLDFRHWDFFFLFAFLMGLYSLHRLTMVTEVGEVEKKVVIHELISEVRKRMLNLSTVGGLSQMVSLSIGEVKNARTNIRNGK